MNFTPFSGQFAGSIPASSVHQFTTAKFAQNIATANGQVVGVLSGGEGGVHYLRPVEGSSFTGTPTTTAPQTLITLPITMPGAKPGDAQQTVQIQVVNPNATQAIQQPKYQVAQMQIPIQHFQQGTTVLTVAYSPQDGSEGVQILGGQGLPEGMTVVAAIQPQDLQLLAAGGSPVITTTDSTHDSDKEMRPIKTEVIHDSESNHVETLPLSLHHFLKFSAETIKRESQVESSPLSAAEMDGATIELIQQPEASDVIDDGTGKPKKKKKYKKKIPKPKKPKPGQVHIATALDGTTLFCCPECHMAYPEKEALEQHLIGHKIERRFICDICGAGLKRKEHLERHKLGHNPDRPFICSVCMKGFKRKEHLNLHFVIHSGEKTEVCGECGKGFYRKDHLRKHARSHITRKIKEEMSQQAQQSQQQQQNAQTEMHITIPSSVTIQVPTSSMSVPVQIAVPQHLVSTTAGETLVTTVDSGSTVVLPTAAETGAMSILHHH